MNIPAIVVHNYSKNVEFESSVGVELSHMRSERSMTVETDDLTIRFRLRQSKCITESIPQESQIPRSSNDKRRFRTIQI